VILGENMSKKNRISSYPAEKRPMRKTQLVLMGCVCGICLAFLMGFIPHLEKPLEHYYPKAIFQLERNGYSVAYNGRTKGAVWVYEQLTPELASNNKVSRKGFRFIEDTDIPEILRSTNADFKSSGYVKGHLHPAMNAKSNDESMRDSFLLTNVCPQIGCLNNGPWRSIEMQLYKLARTGKTLHIYTLPLFIPIELDGKRFVHYQVIGENDVAVPTHFAKVALIEEDELTIAYILPNAKIPANTPIETFKTTIDKVEKIAGVVFPHLFLK